MRMLVLCTLLVNLSATPAEAGPSLGGGTLRNYATCATGVLKVDGDATFPTVDACMSPSGVQVGVVRCTTGDVVNVPGRDYCTVL